MEQLQSLEYKSPRPQPSQTLSPRSETKLRFVQALGGQKIEPNVYHLTKPYFETYRSLKDNKPCLYNAIEGENLRFDYSDRTLRFKTSTPQTEFANAKVISSIVLALYTISQDASQNSDTIKLVDSINSFGSTVIKGAYCVYEPSCQFRLFNPSIAKRPGVVIEVAWSRPWKVLEKKMSDLLEVGGGMTRAVIGVELVESAPGHMKVFLSFWRLGAPYEVVWDRAEIGADDERALCLTLSDFISRDTCANYFPRAELETEILIPLGKIYQSAQWGFELWQEEKQQDEI